LLQFISALPPRLPGEGQEPVLPSTPAFAGVDGTVAILRRLMKRVNGSEHQENGRPDCRAVPRRKRFAPTYRADRK